jgi:recombination protein RecR
MRQLQRIPYLASKNVYRVISYFLDSDSKSVEQLCQAILEAKQHIKPCLSCFNWTEGRDLCGICSDGRRDAKVICIVETWHDLMALEKSGEFRGVYHVLGGVLCPLEGVGPDQLRVQELLTRLTPDVQEIIFAMNPTPEGEATASYLASKMQKGSVAFSRLASGVPIGSSLEYMDRVTISKALLGRRPF